MRTALALLLASLPAAALAAGPVLPPDGAQLRRTHVEFRWEPVCQVGSYDLEVARDDGRGDPFAAGAPVVRRRVGGLEPRAVVTSGLDFGGDYAWRVRGVARGPRGAPGRGGGGESREWSAVRHFRIAELPDTLPTWTVSEPEPGPVQPGLTILDIAGRNRIGFPPVNRAVAVDRSGRPVWFNAPFEFSLDTRLLPSGRVSYIDGPRAFETTLDGEITWASPDDPTLQVHHEVFPMPNGNFLAVTFDPREFLIDGALVTLRGDRIVEFDRETHEIVWEWATLDHWSIVDMPPGDSGRAQNWSHVNAVVYDERSRSVTISSRNLSRVTRIDYDTRQVVYNMGQQMPSGDVDFGDGLFRLQHAPEILRNRRMLLHDNGSPDDPVSRIIELQFDDPEAPSSARIVWEYVLPVFSRIIGDADRQPNGNTVIASGVRPGAVYEVTRGGRMVWSMVVDESVIYRAERIPALVVRSPAERLAALMHAALFRMSCASRSDAAQRAETGKRLRAFGGR